jgi:peptide methionine sulfoxide reductase MsrA
MNKNKNLVSLDILWDVAKKKNIDKYIKNIQYSDKPDKKYIITNINNKNIYIGSSIHQDYLKHHNELRKINFRSRFKKLFEKNKNNINSAMFFSWYLLW